MQFKHYFYLVASLGASPSAPMAYKKIFLFMVVPLPRKV